MIKMKNYVVIAILSLTTFACKKEVSVVAPLDVTTNHITEVEWTTANCEAQVNTDGGSIVAFRGVVWSKNPNPTLDLSTKTNDGRGVGEFISKMTNLEPGTKYYVKSYAINTTDTIYGNELSFTTSSWTPKQIEKTWDWWNSQFGLQKKGSYLKYWKGVNGVELEYGNEYNLGLVNNSDKDWGDQPSITFNPDFKRTDCGYYTKLNTNKTSKTAILVCKMINLHTNTENTLLSVNSNTYPRFGIWGYSNSKYMFFNSNFPYQYGGTQSKNFNYQFIRISYDRDKGFIDFYVDEVPNFKNKLFSYQSKSNVDYVGGKLSVGYYSKVFGVTPKMSVVELLFVDGIPSDSELTTYSKYLKYKYKL